MTGTSEDDAVVIGWLGVGIMGEAMCSRLLNAGIKVVVWNRTAAKVRLQGGGRLSLRPTRNRQPERRG